jgi:hypothetical protein
MVHYEGQLMSNERGLILSACISIHMCTGEKDEAMS